MLRINLIVMQTILRHSYILSLPKGMVYLQYGLWGWNKRIQKLDGKTGRPWAFIIVSYKLISISNGRSKIVETGFDKNLAIFTTA